MVLAGLVAMTSLVDCDNQPQKPKGQKRLRNYDNEPLPNEQQDGKSAQPNADGKSGTQPANPETKTGPGPGQ
jgi:hypothetical protein